MKAVTPAPLFSFNIIVKWFLVKGLNCNVIQAVKTDLRKLTVVLGDKNFRVSFGLQKVLENLKLYETST